MGERYLSIKTDAPGEVMGSTGSHSNHEVSGLRSAHRSCFCHGGRQDRRRIWVQGPLRAPSGVSELRLPLLWWLPGQRELGCVCCSLLQVPCGGASWRAQHQGHRGNRAVHPLLPCHPPPQLQATTCYLLPTTYYILPSTTYYLLPTTYYLLPTTYYHLLPTTYYLLPTTYYLLPTPCYLLPATTYYYLLLPTTTYSYLLL